MSATWLRHSARRPATRSAEARALLSFEFQFFRELFVTVAYQEYLISSSDLFKVETLFISIS